MGRLDDLIRIAGAYAPPRPMMEAAKELSLGEDRAGQLAEELLRHPEAIRRIDQFIGDYKLQLGRPIGAGAESAVWEVVPRGGGPAQVMKVRPGGMTTDFDFPSDVPGIVPYVAKEQASPSVAVALQPKADVVYQKNFGLEIPFSHASQRVGESLLSRGWYWGDGHKWNLGVMPDGTWGVIDVLVDRAPPDWTLPKRTPEEAIRMLRMTPFERAGVYGDPAL
jgi:hypothetical protein